MAKRQTWLDQLNRYIFPVLVVAIGLYGTWDLIVLPNARIERPLNVCTTTIADVAVFKLSPKSDQPPKRIQAPAGLPIVVPAGETRILSIDVSNPDEKPVIYQWRATYGQFESRYSMQNRSAYIAPRSLINDTLTLEATTQGCAAAKRTIEIAVVPSADVPLLDQPLPAPSPTPLPLPSSSLPTVEP